MRSINVKLQKTFCGGSLISRNFVLTAAHCIDDFESIFKADFGSHVQLSFGTNDCSGNSARISRHPKRIIKHEGFGKGWKYVSDIALIELDSPIEYPADKSIVPICIMDNAFNHKKYFEGKRKVDTTYGRAAGCGNSNNSPLKEVMIPYISQEDCEESFIKSGISLAVTNVTFCAGFTIPRVGDVCEGDSGGALVMADETRWIQTGIVSSGKRCDRGHPSYFTNVGMFYDWIDKITNFSDEEVMLL
uniref:Chymotrypsin-like protease n=1 Tax=Solen grandis TaxID=165599 RepID=I6TRR2_9BIVA|nr:chymotrypsin-like protease [Solen grandis]